VPAGRSCQLEEEKEYIKGVAHKKCVEGAKCKKYCESGKEKDKYACNEWCVLENG